MNLFIVGRKYQGKTTFALWLANRIREEFHGYKILVFEPKWTFRSVPYTTRQEEFAELIKDDERAPDIAMLHSGSGREEKNDTRQIRKEFEQFYEIAGIDDFLANPPERPIIVLIDEAYYLTMEKPDVDPNLARMMRLASEGKLYVIICVHYPTQISRDLRTHVDKYYFFREFDAADLQMIQRLCGEECARIVASLPDHHILVYTVRDRSFTIWNEPELWYSDIGEDWRKSPSERDDIEVSSAT